MTLEEGNCYDELVYTYCLSFNVSAGTDVGRGSLIQPAIWLPSAIVTLDYPTRVSGCMDMPGVNLPDMPRTPMLSGEWRKTISTIDRALSPHTHIIICTSFISSMIRTVFYRITETHKWPLVPKRDVKQKFTGNYTIKKQWNSRDTCTLCLHHSICSVLLSS